MATNSKLKQELKNEWIYFLEEKRNSGNIYAFVCTDIPSEQLLIQDIETKHAKLKGKLLPFKKIRLDEENAKKWFRNELNQLNHNGAILTEYYDHENHDILYIKTPTGADKNAEIIIKELIKRYPVKKNSNSNTTGVSILLVVGVMLGISFISGLSVESESESEPILRNTSSESESYKNCVDGDGGRACLKLTKTYKHCVNNGGGKACEKHLND